MKFGAMTFPIKPVLAEIDAISRLQFDYVELAMDPPMAHHSILRPCEASIRHALRDSKLGLVCHLPTFVTTADLTESLRKASVREMHRSLTLAAELGAKKVVLHPSPVVGLGALVLETVKRHAFDFLSGIVGAAERMAVTLCLENMFPRNGLGVEPDDLEELFNTFPALKMTLDTGHANIGDRGGRRLKSLLERFGHRIDHLHLSDNRGKRDDHLAVGKGTVQFKPLVRQLQRIGYDDTLTLEVFEPDRNMLVRSKERIQTLLIGQK